MMEMIPEGGWFSRHWDVIFVIYTVNCLHMILLRRILSANMITNMVDCVHSHTLNVKLFKHVFN